MRKDEMSQTGHHIYVNKRVLQNTLIGDIEFVIFLHIYLK